MDTQATGKTLRLTRRRLLGAAVVALILVAGAGLWLSHAVTESVQDLLTANLEANLDVSATALKAWIDGELALVNFWAGAERLRRLVEARLRDGVGDDAGQEKLQQILN